ncbi:hypothetical protein IW492_12085 [Enterococcus sp. BWB1-3]|uniref:hypothetical protein n=1 Tax=unclassified Enterococcus TaxID=2608891 RepID=UPI001924E11C|nr:MULTISPECIES: hypothetical protein [unclassified Enterococcus]MBL1229973.1 hypothetical protein [Enterococcus sp. BWB1-3]MCB5952970.1 hypothetical protein [Enterococcus sp. BWT-B8]
MKKKLFIAMCLLTVFGSFFGKEVFAEAVESKQSIVQTRADIIGWRYKTKNGKMYKRKYNYSKQKWMGNWILAV